MLKGVEVPIELPAGWRATSDQRGVVIDAVDVDGRMQGSVTVCEKVRGFALGVCSVRRPAESRYVGRGWQVKLYSDAVTSLQAVFSRRSSMQLTVESQGHA